MSSQEVLVAPHVFADYSKYLLVATASDDSNGSVLLTEKNDLKFEQHKVLCKVPTSSGATATTFYKTKYVIWGTRAGQIIVYDLRKKQVIFSENTHSNNVWQFKIYGKFLFSSSWDKTVVVKTLSNKHQGSKVLKRFDTISKLEGQTDYIYTVDCIPLLNIAVVGCYNNMLSLYQSNDHWETSKMVAFHKFDKSIFTLKAYQTTSDRMENSHHIAVGVSAEMSLVKLAKQTSSTPGELAVFPLESSLNGTTTYSLQKNGETLKVHKDAIWNIRHVPGFDYLITCSWDASICIWDALGEGKLISKVDVHSAVVRTVDYFMKGTSELVLVSGSEDKTICFTDVTLNGKERTATPNTKQNSRWSSVHSGWVLNLEIWSPNNDYIMSGELKEFHRKLYRLNNPHSDIRIAFSA